MGQLSRACRLFSAVERAKGKKQPQHNAKGGCRSWSAQQFNSYHEAIDAGDLDFDTFCCRVVAWDEFRLVAGTSVELDGTLVKSPGKEQAYELQVSNMKIVGSCDGEVSIKRST